MQTITVTGACNISYEILKDYHATAQAIYDIRLKQNQSQEVEYLYEIDIEAEDEKDAEEIFLTYLRKLNELGVALSAGHLVYITQHLIKFEGNYMEEEAPLDRELTGEIELLIKLLELHKQTSTPDLVMEITHKVYGKEFGNYTKLEDPDLIATATLAMAQSLFDSIKKNSHLHPINLQESIANLNSLDLEKIKDIKSKLISVTEKTFRSQFLYTVCRTLMDYLNKYSALNPDGAATTNNMLRVIYQTCKIHNLIPRDHEGYEPAEINFMRSVIANGTHGTMLGVLTDQQ